MNLVNIKKMEQTLQNKFELACSKLDIVPSVPNLDAIPSKFRDRLLELYYLMVIDEYNIKKKYLDN